MRLVWRAALDVLRPVLAVAILDLFPAPAWGERYDALAHEARQGWETLHVVAPASGMGVWVDLTDDELFRAFRNYGIESIHTLAVSAAAAENKRHSRTKIIGPFVWRLGSPYPFVYNHDSGWSTFYELTDAEYSQLSSVLSDQSIDPGALVGPLTTEQAAKQ